MCVCALHFMLEVLSRLWANVLCTCSIRLWLRKRNRANWKQIETDWFKLFEIDFAILLEGRCSRPGRCISNFPSMWLLQPTRRAVLCRCRACTRLGRDLHGSCGWPQGGATSVAVGKSTGNRFQSVCEPWRRLRLHAVQKDRFSAVPKGSQWTHSQLN